MIPQVALDSLEHAVNAYLHLDPEMAGRLQRLPNKMLAIELTQIPLPILLYMQADKGRLRIYSQCTEEVATRIVATPFALGIMCLIQDAERSRRLLAGELAIEGDVEFGLEFKNVIDDIDIDWEEYLSYALGDVVAHQVGSKITQCKALADHLLTSLRLNSTEYLQEESAHLPPREEVTDFVADLDQVAMAVDRLEARMQRLQQVGDGS